MNVVLVTGGCGFLGKQVVNHLATYFWKSVDRVISFDIRDVPEGERLDSRRVVYCVGDITSKDSVNQVIKDHKVTLVVHLAAIVPPSGRSREFEYSVDVGGTKNVLEACVEFKVKKIIVTSSGAAYGYHADNPKLLFETDAIRGNEAFPYSWHKRQVEALLEEYRKKHPELLQLVFRPGTILGDTVNNAITNLFKRKIMFGITGALSPFCFVWDQDCVQAIARGVKDHPRVGIFNLTGDGSLPMYEIAQRLNKPYFTIPAFMVKLGLFVLKPLRLSIYGPEQVDFLRYRPVLSPKKISQEFGFTPLSSHECFARYKASHPELSGTTSSWCSLIWNKVKWIPKAALLIAIPILRLENVFTLVDKLYELSYPGRVVALGATVGLGLACRSWYNKTFNPPPKVLGGEIIAKILAKDGVKVVFGIIDGTYFGLYSTLRKHGIKFISPRRENAAAEMAGAYAKATGQLGVCMASNGPGCANILAGVASQNLEGNRVLLITSCRREGIAYPDRGGSFQCFDQSGVIAPMSKFTAVVPNASRVAEITRLVLRKCWNRQAPGVVHLDVPESVMNTPVVPSVSWFRPNAASYRVTHPIESSESCKELSAELGQCKCIGVIANGDVDSFEFDELLDAWQGLNDSGCVLIKPHELQRALAEPNKFDSFLLLDYVPSAEEIGQLTAKTQKIFCVSSDPEVTVKNCRLHLYASPRSVLSELLLNNTNKSKGTKSSETISVTPWSGEVKNISTLLQYIESVSAICITDPAAYPFLPKNIQKVVSKYSFFNCLASGNGISAAIGVQVAHPNRRVVCIMEQYQLFDNCQEVETAVREKLPILFVFIGKNGESINTTEVDYNKLAGSFGIECVTSFTVPETNKKDVPSFFLLKDPVAELKEYQSTFSDHCLQEKKAMVTLLEKKFSANPKIQVMPFGPFHTSSSVFMSGAFARCSSGLGCVVLNGMVEIANSLHGIVTEHHEGNRVLIVSFGEVPKQKFNLEAIMKCTSKFSLFVSADDFDDGLFQAVQHSFAGKPGVVLLHVNIRTLSELPLAKHSAALPLIFRPSLAPPKSELAKLTTLLTQCKRPLVHFGTGVSHAGVADEAMNFSKKLGAVVTTSWGSRCCVCENGKDSDRALLVPFIYVKANNVAHQTADLVIILGSRLGETDWWGKAPYWAVPSKQKIVYVDIDTGNLGNVREAALCIQADLETFLTSSLKHFENFSKPVDHQWFAQLTAAKDARRQELDKKFLSNPSQLTTAVAAKACQSILEAGNNSTVLAIDGGNTSVWTMFFHQITSQHSVIGTPKMGLLGAANGQILGAKLASPKRRVYTLTGDGAFAMHMQEVLAAVRMKLKVLFVVITDKQWGMVKLGQMMGLNPLKTFFKGTLSSSEVINSDFNTINFGLFAESVGATGKEVNDVPSLTAALEEFANGKEEKPMVIQVNVDVVKHLWAPELLTFRAMHLEPSGIEGKY